MPAELQRPELPVLAVVGAPSVGKKAVLSRVIGVPCEAATSSNTVIWNIDTRYYTADVSCLIAEPHQAARADEYEAVILVFAADQQPSFLACKQWAVQADLSRAELKLCISNKSDRLSVSEDSLQRPPWLEDCKEWCCQEFFEFIEVCPLAKGLLPTARTQVSACTFRALSHCNDLRQVRVHKSQDISHQARATQTGKQASDVCLFGQGGVNTCVFTCRSVRKIWNWMGSWQTEMGSNRAFAGWSPPCRHILGQACGSIRGSCSLQTPHSLWMVRCRLPQAAAQLAHLRYCQYVCGKHIQLAAGQEAQQTAQAAQPTEPTEPSSNGAAVSHQVNGALPNGFGGVHLPDGASASLRQDVPADTQAATVASASGHAAAEGSNAGEPRDENEMDHFERVLSQVLLECRAHSLH